MKTIKFKLLIEPSKHGYSETRVTHIQIRKDGKFEGFSKHTSDLIELINNTEFIIPEQ